VDKRWSSLIRQRAEVTGSFQGEYLSEHLVEQAALIPLDKICADPEFENLRLPPTAEEVSLRAESMRREGLKVPVEVIPVPGTDCFYLRAGFRRVAAARLLRWESIPAIVLRPDTPLVDEYWTNVIENTARDRLSTYEIAYAARAMRDRFGVSAAEFAVRAGFSETYVVNLLRCLDRLPPEVVEAWRNKAPVPIGEYVKWCNLLPHEAVSAMRVYMGRNPQLAREWKHLPPSSPKSHPARMASTVGLKRMQRLRFAVEVARGIDEKTRALCLELVDFCSGARERVTGIYADGQKMRTYKSRRRADQVTLEDLNLGAVVE
jgi:ParB/RepB/Spo0J family partition protein